LLLFGGRLTDVAVKNARARDRAYKKSDGRGLCLLVQPNGAKWWRFRYKWARKEQMLSLGTYPDTSLADARKEREKARQDLANDINPADERRNANLPDRLFEAVARHWLGKLAKKVRLGKRSVKTLEKATWALETYVFPLESLPVSAIRRLRGQMPSEGEDRMRNTGGMGLIDRHSATLCGAQPDLIADFERSGRIAEVGAIALSDDGDLQRLRIQTCSNPRDATRCWVARLEELAQIALLPGNEDGSIGRPPQVVW